MKNETSQSAYWDLFVGIALFVFMMVWFRRFVDVF